VNSTGAAGTPARRTTRRIGSAVVVAAIAAAGIGIGAGTASAKSAIAVGVRSHIVTVGRAVQVSASGDSDDFGGTPMQLCLDERVGGGGWQQLRCVPGSSLHLSVRAQHRGELQFRAQLFALVSKDHRVLDRTSGAVSVWVH
jgi:hypothetical protein